MGLFYEGTAAEADQIAGHENNRQYISHDPRPVWRDFLENNGSKDGYDALV